MSIDAINPELHGPLLVFGQHCEQLLIAHRHIEASGNLAVGSMELHAGAFTPKRDSGIARRRTDELNLILLRRIEDAVSLMQTRLFGDRAEYPNANYVYRNVNPPKGLDGYVRSLNLQPADDDTPITLVAAEKHKDDDREGLTIVVREERLVAASLTRVSKRSEAFAEGCAAIFGDDHPVIDLIAGEFSGDEELEISLDAIRHDIDIVGYSEEEKQKRLALLDFVPQYAMRTQLEVRIDRTAIEGFTHFVNSLVSK